MVVKQPQKRKRTASDRIAAALPGVLGLGLIAAGLGLIAAGLGVVWYAKEYPPHEFSGRFVVLLLAGGVASLGYWALANNDDGYNF